jgi:tetratricopeptide (TPR) repeat protein
MKEIIEKYGRNEPLSAEETNCMNTFIQGEKAHLQRLRKSHQRLQTVKRTFAVAASILLLGWVGNFFARPVMPNYEQLATAYLTEKPPHSTLKTPMTTLVEAKNAYQEEQFAKAASLFKKAIESGEADENAYFYGAMSYLYQQKPDFQMVTKFLSHLKTHSNGYETDNVLWYLSLAYIKTGQLSAAQTNLDELITSGYLNKEKAQQLVSSLKTNKK